MSRVINTEGSGKQRNQLLRATALALRELADPTHSIALRRDLAAFIALTLEAIAGTIDPSVQAWEKRGYWVKADQFRLEWAWAEKEGLAMRRALLADDWSAVALVAARVAARLGRLTVSPRHRMGTPWIGAWARLQSISS